MFCKECEMKRKGVAAGQGFTEFTCVLCDGKDIWHNTNKPKICEKCSEKLHICQDCGRVVE